MWSAFFTYAPLDGRHECPFLWPEAAVLGAVVWKKHFQLVMEICHVLGMRGPYPHMQRAFSVDVAVHSALSDIQNAVKRNSTVRLKSSTMSIIERTQPPSQPGIQEEDDIPVWIKR